MSDDLTAVQDGDTDGVKSLRQALAKEKSDRAADRQLLEGLLTEQRTRKIGEALKERGIKEGFAELVPSTLETDKLDEWLNAKADLFGFAAQQESPENQAEAQSQNRSAQLFNRTSAPEQSHDLSAVKAAKSMEDLDRLILSAENGQL